MKKKRTRKYGTGLLMIAPTIIGLIILNIIPLIQTFILSMQDASAFGAAQFVGLDNYIKMFQSSEMWKATFNTLLFVVYTVPVGIVISLVIAVLLNAKIKGKTLFRAVFFMPMIVAPAAIAMVWKLLFNAEFGIINTVLRTIGFEGTNWLTNDNTILLVCAIVTIWSAVGYDAIILLSGLQGISSTYYEAAKLDGASGIQSFFHITLPMVSPTLFFTIIMRVMGSLKVFDVIYMMIESSNPAINSARTLMGLFYRESFELGNRGYGSAIVIWTLFIIGAVTVIQFVGEKKLVNYDA